MHETTCANCGFLTVLKLEDRQLASAEAGLRQTGELPSKGQYWIYDPVPFCLMRATDLKEQMGDNPTDDLRRTTLTAIRNCDQFTRWQPGLTPKEHLEMVQLEALRKEQREEAERNRQFQRERDADQKRQAEDQRRHQWRTLAVAICGLLVAAYTALKSKEPPPAPVFNVKLPGGAILAKEEPKVDEKPKAEPSEPDAAKAE